MAGFCLKRSFSTTTCTNFFVILAMYPFYFYSFLVVTLTRFFSMNFLSFSNCFALRSLMILSRHSMIILNNITISSLMYFLLFLEITFILRRLFPHKIADVATHVLGKSSRDLLPVNFHFNGCWQDVLDFMVLHRHWGKLLAGGSNTCSLFITCHGWFVSAVSLSLVREAGWSYKYGGICYECSCCLQ